MHKKVYILKENRGIRRLLHRLFSTTNQPYVPRLKVLCRFYSKSLFAFERMVEVDYPEWHFEPEIVDGLVVGERLVLDAGYITLYDKKERYWAGGTPPFIYLIDDPTPCPNWMVRMLEEDRKRC